MVERRKNISKNLKLCSVSKYVQYPCFFVKGAKIWSVTEPLRAEPLRLWLGFRSANHFERALRDSCALGPKSEQNEQIRVTKLPNRNNRG